MDTPSPYSKEMSRIYYYLYKISKTEDDHNLLIFKIINKSKHFVLVVIRNSNLRQRVSSIACMSYMLLILFTIVSFLDLCITRSVIKNSTGTLKMSFLYKKLFALSI